MVSRPDHTKIQARNGVRYVYHICGRRRTSSGKSYTEQRVEIGMMVDNDMKSNDKKMYPNERFYEYYPEETREYKETPVFSNTLKTGGILLINKILKDLQLDELIDNIYEEDAAHVINLLTYMILFETTTFQHYPALMRNHPVKGMKLISDSYISDFLKKEEQPERTRLFLTAWNQIHSKEDVVYIGYDSTNINNQSCGIEMAEYGHPKIDIGAPQVNLSYAIDMQDSKPLFYELYPGSIIDNSECTKMVEKAQDYGYANVGFILDRGYFSKHNITFMDAKHYGFVIMLKENYQCVKDVISSAQGQIEKFKFKYYIKEHGVYGMTIKGKLYSTDKHIRYFHVFYDNERAAGMQDSIMKTIVTQEERLNEKREKTKGLREKDVEEYKTTFNLRFDSNGYLIGVSRKEARIKRMMDEAGFFVICTSEEMTAAEALDIYRERDASEKLFRLLKTELGYDKLAVYSDEAVMTKTQLVFMATIVRNAIYQGLKPVIKKTGDRKHFTVNAAIHELENIEATKNLHGKYQYQYALTKAQKQILSAFDLSEKDVEQIALQASRSA